MKLNQLTKIAVAAYFNFLFLPSVQAGILSVNLCKPYRRIFDNELFVVIAVIACAVLLIVWKLAPSSTTMSRAMGILSALALALNLDLFFQSVYGTGLAC